jgi:hypothetical protein
MTNANDYKVDRTGWPTGPWDAEPDRLEWRTKAGLPGLIKRSPMSGSWCGYVAVPPGHPLHSRDYDDVNIAVHGGLTYGGPCRGAICHVPEPGEADNVWWLGFDCGHHLDISPGIPGMAKTFADLSEVQYRDVAYVTAEVEQLAEQVVRARRTRGASDMTLLRRVGYGGRKGRSAARRLRANGLTGWLWPDPLS